MRPFCHLTVLTALLVAGCDRGGHKKSAQTPDASSAAIGRLMVRPPAGPASAAGSIAENLFFEEQIRILGSAELHQRAETAVLHSKPALKIEGVTVQIVRERAGSVLSVIGRSANPEFARAFVDELMEAYVATKQRNSADETAGGSPETAAARKALKEAERVWATFKLEHEPVRLASDRADADRLLKKFEMSQKWFEKEVDAVGKLSLEDDIRRRQTAGPLPVEMPAELALMARVSPTLGELGYLSALKSANEIAVRAAEATATKDRAARVDTLRKQIELIADLSADTTKKRDKLASYEAEGAKLQADLNAAEEKVRAIATAEREKSVSAPGTESPGAASIIERATPWAR